MCVLLFDFFGEFVLIYCIVYGCFIGGILVFIGGYNLFEVVCFVKLVVVGFLM